VICTIGNQNSYNLGFEALAQLTNRVCYEDIQRITDWYPHNEALHAALADLVNAMLGLDTTQIWGDASTSHGPDANPPRGHPARSLTAGDH
jgi:hypothetical protein